MTETFIEKLLNVINTKETCYYDKVPKTVTFPYCVIPTLSISPLNNGYSYLFDIEIYTNELNNGTKSAETIADELRELLDNYSYRDTTIGFHIGFDSQYLTREQDQDLIYRRVTFVARLFY